MSTVPYLPFLPRNDRHMYVHDPFLQHHDPCAPMVAEPSLFIFPRFKRQRPFRHQSDVGRGVITHITRAVKCTPQPCGAAAGETSVPNERRDCRRGARNVQKRAQRWAAIPLLIVYSRKCFSVYNFYFTTSPSFDIQWLIVHPNSFLHLNSGKKSRQSGIGSGLQVKCTCTWYFDRFVETGARSIQWYSPHYPQNRHMRTQAHKNGALCDGAVVASFRQMIVCTTRHR